MLNLSYFFPLFVARLKEQLCQLILDKYELTSKYLPAQPSPILEHALGDISILLELFAGC